MTPKEIQILPGQALELESFRKMDYHAVEHYQLPVILMMEHAGLALARMIANKVEKDELVRIGIGNGNNGGGGLVAARRLAAWGYPVCLDLAFKLTKELPVKQLEIALKFGVKTESEYSPRVWVDAYLGFSQRLPLSTFLLDKVEEANRSSAIRISLDIPTGFTGDPSLPYFRPDIIVTLAAPKKILFELDPEIEIYLADLGIPKPVYENFRITPFPFDESGILKIKR